MSECERTVRRRVAAFARDVAAVLRGVTFGRHLDRYDPPGGRARDSDDAADSGRDADADRERR